MDGMSSRDKLVEARAEAAAFEAERRADHKERLRTMTDRELASYWNVIQMDKRMIGDRNTSEFHESIVGELLAERGIAYEAGKLLVTSMPLQKAVS
jgi:hypothetical protein